MFKYAGPLAVVLLAAACGSTERASRLQAAPEPQPSQRHLVYEKLGGRGIWIADRDGSDPRLLDSRGRKPVISPDGKWVAYVGGCRDDFECAGTFVVSTSGGKPRKVSSDSGLEPSPAAAWSPDSERLVVARGTWPHPRTLVSIDLASGNERKLADGVVGQWSFSPDGKQIVCVREQRGGTDLFVVDSTAGDPDRLTHTGDAHAPVWGPKAIAFARELENGETFGNEIWQVQPDGSGLEPITGRLHAPYVGDGGNGSGGVIPIAWSEDGRALLGAWLLGADAVPVAVDPDNGAIRELADNAAYTVAISHDGGAALAATYPTIGGWSDDTATVLIVPYAGGKPAVVARGAGSPSWNR